MPERELHEFHWTDGWTFKRLDDGSVRIRHNADEAIVPKAEWVSIVAAVGQSFGSAEDFSAAERVHLGQSTPW
jgi:hypothetical protein